MRRLHLRYRIAHPDPDLIADSIGWQLRHLALAENYYFEYVPDEFPANHRLRRFLALFGNHQHCQCCDISPVLSVFHGETHVTDCRVVNVPATSPGGFRDLRTQRRLLANLHDILWQYERGVELPAETELKWNRRAG